MKNYRSSEKVHAGYMADIAFLLLIFFLVTTTISIDAGINRNLPDYCPTNDCATHKAERNVLRIILNAENDIFMNSEYVSLENLKNKVKLFLDNNGDSSCEYCQGLGDNNASDNPQEAAISLQHNRQTSYELFIKVQDEISKSIMELRKTYCENIFQKPLELATKTERQAVKKAYPLLITEVVMN